MSPSTRAGPSIAVVYWDHSKREVPAVHTVQHLHLLLSSDLAAGAHLVRP